MTQHEIISRKPEGPRAQVYVKNVFHINVGQEQFNSDQKRIQNRPKGHQEGCYGGQVGVAASLENTQNAATHLGGHFDGPFWS